MYINKIHGEFISPKKLTEVIATVEQAEQIAQVQKEIQKTVLKDDINKPVFAIDSKEFIESIILSRRGEVILYYEEKELVCFFELCCPNNYNEIIEKYHICKYINNIDYKNIGVAESFVVLPKYRGNGLHKKMLQRIEEIAKERGITSLIATVHPKNIYSCNNFDLCNYKTITKLNLYGSERYLKYKLID